MSADKYVPGEALLRIAWSDYCQSMDACNAWVRPDGVDPRAEFDRFLAKVKRDAFEKGIATGYMRGYHDSEVGLLYSPPIPPTTPEETP